MLEIGRKLKEGRVARGLDLSDIAKRTRISGYYLKAMEEGRFHIIPKVYDRGYLKIYANLLNIESQSLLALYEKMQREALSPKSNNTSLPS
ncbi:MAG: helix-turn-helix domain-containing protein [Nitrospirota bacterium]